jgi:galactokinase/mevalonate kinase-like predicted kinase
MHPLVQAILAPDAASKVGAFERFARGASLAELLESGKVLHGFAVDGERNAYQRVRAAFYAHALYRYALPRRPELPRAGKIPWHAHELLLERRYAAACDVLLAAVAAAGASDALASALASAYHGLGFQILAAQVQRSVRALRGNRWMFRTGHALDLPLRVRPELLAADASGFGRVLVERTPVRMDLSHSGWSDIFFLGMDFPEGARVLNVSVDLAVRGRDQATHPPITCFFRVIEEPVLRLASVDLDAAADLAEVAEVFDYARDHLGVLKAAVVASGLVPPALEGSGQSLRLVLEQLVGPGRGIELVSQVSDIPKGSRLAVSTNLLGGLISLCMRATGQVAALTGPLADAERRTVAGRALLGEWLGGSGGGWQDSGGLWPGIKLIEGVPASSEDVEHGSSRGRLLPRHTILESSVVSPEARKRLEDSLVLVHGGMAANVGPILEMVTEKFLLGAEREWQARKELLETFDAIVAALCAGDVRELGRLTTRSFRGPLETIVPWVTNAYTERLIREAEAALGEDFWGFWMLGGMSGGGMGFIVEPARKAEAETLLQESMLRAKQDLESSLPFAMEPVVYGFSINEQGTSAELLSGPNAILSPEYYVFQLPRWHEQGSRSFSGARRRELDAFANEHLRGERAEGVGRALVRRLFPSSASQANGPSLDALLERYGFDPEQHERIRRDLLAGRIGLAQNRLPADTLVEDVRAGDVTPYASIGADAESLGRAALARGEACVVTLAAGAGSRWTQGAGTVKALHPFAKLGGRFRTFVEVHLAKTARAGAVAGRVPAHVLTTSFLTHAPLERLLEREGRYGFTGPLLLSPGSSIGLRLVPTARDLRFAWEQMPEQKLEERKQKVRESGRKGLLDWVADKGEASDYRDNVATQCVHPVGHFYEIANLVLNGTLRRLLEAQPSLRYFLVHNIDTLGADLDPRLFGRHLERGATFSFEVIERRLEDRGGGLARVGGRPRIVEGLALPSDEDEAKLRFYNSLTTWVTIDPLLALFGLTRESLADETLARRGVRALAARLPTYVTLKEVKRRWGNAQEDVLTVAQFEKLWGDVSALPDVAIQYFVVPRERGQQLKDVAQLDGWARDGSREYIERITGFVE